ncbi:Protein of unknown function (DUF3602) [Geosmithia morbida]|uniref:Uncharacterized protein n=1 Tax=Geosmithia morbida TaxID=1094350 RepID=A0A9P5D268_9HYPO|nr:Protein of unknown function (DUF3602) [Geosmithia morbida]KAF4121186.1 Protein of unknown function (DUF3602) [Geosmithia morbida]
MSHDTFRNVGRGGAGNFYSVNEVQKGSRDLEAAEHQTASTGHVSPLPPITHQPTVPARAGRGGAGNLILPGDGNGNGSGNGGNASYRSHHPHNHNHNGSRVDEDAYALAEDTAAAVRRNPTASRAPAAHSGRGGAGNWAANAAVTEKQAEESRRTAELEDKVRHVVEQGLKMPQKAHYAFEKHTGP